MPEPSSKTESEPFAWKQAVDNHPRSVLRSSVWQLVNTLIPYIALRGLMIWTLDISYWITLVLAVVPPLGRATEATGRFRPTQGPSTGNVFTSGQAGERVPSCCS